MNFADFQDRAHSRNVFLWGARTLGIAAAKKLQTLGVKVAGFIDSVKRLEKINNIPVLSDEEFFSSYTPDTCFVLICTQAFGEVISEKLERGGFSKNDYFDYNNLMNLHYYIETNNRCNLRCKTCSVSSMYNSQFHNMEFGNFKKIIDKIAIEDPLVPYLFLYGNNEPLLSPDLPEKICYCKEKGFSIGLSSNLNPNADFEALVKAKPDWLRISLSGWGERYEQMHRGGNFEKLLEHMRLLSTLQSSLAPEMTVEVIFHKYKNNTQDMHRVKQLCEDLNFQFSYIYAAIIGLEVVSAYLDNKPIPRAMFESLPLLCHSVEKLAQKCYEARHMECSYKQVLRIASDASMASCHCYIGSTMPDANFITTSFEDIKHALRHSPLCSQCQSKGLHTFCLHVFDESTHDD